MTAEQPRSLPWRTVRVFISSTFQDMHAERDHLVKVVFPQMRESLEKDHIHLVDIDLRWGVTVEQADNDLVLDLCLKQIDECRPFFVGILGERYGWVPKSFPVEARRNFGWIQYHTGKSLTELEMLHGVLNNPAMYDRAMFLLRDPAFIVSLSDEQRGVYGEGPTDEELLDLSSEETEACAEVRRRKLQHLKASVRALGDRVFVFDGYPCRWDPEAQDPAGGKPGRLGGLEEFGEQLRVHLEQVIRTAPELREHLAALASPPPDPHGLLEERDYHERFAESRLQIYVGREDIHSDLVGYLEDDRTTPLVVVGGSGSGKSAILARLGRDYVAAHPGNVRPAALHWRKPGLDQRVRNAAAFLRGAAGAVRPDADGEAGYRSRWQGTARGQAV